MVFHLRTLWWGSHYDTNQPLYCDLEWRNDVRLKVFGMEWEEHLLSFDWKTYAPIWLKYLCDACAVLRMIRWTVFQMLPCFLLKSTFHQPRDSLFLEVWICQDHQWWICLRCGASVLVCRRIPHRSCLLMKNIYTCTYSTYIRCIIPTCVATDLFRIVPVILYGNPGGFPLAKSFCLVAWLTKSIHSKTPQVKEFDTSFIDHWTLISTAHLDFKKLNSYISVSKLLTEVTLCLLSYLFIAELPLTPHH